MIRSFLAAYGKARSNLLLMLGLTVVNVVLLAVGAPLSFPFSAFLPQLAVDFGLSFTELTGNVAFILLGGALAAATVGIYLLSWKLSEKNWRWLVTALVIFSIDCAALLAWFVFTGFDAYYIIDILFHVWVMICLVPGARAGAELSKLTSEQLAELGESLSAESTAADEDAGASDSAPLESVPLRPDMSRGRVLLEGEYQGLKLSVRRSFGLTELIADGKVYAERRGIVEGPYRLAARVGGVMISTEMEQKIGYMMMYLYADGNVLAQKKRLA